MNILHVCFIEPVISEGRAAVARDPRGATLLSVNAFAEDTGASSRPPLPGPWRGIGIKTLADHKAQQAKDADGPKLVKKKKKKKEGGGGGEGGVSKANNMAIKVTESSAREPPR